MIKKSRKSIFVIFIATTIIVGILSPVFYAFAEATPAQTAGQNSTGAGGGPSPGYGPPGAGPGGEKSSVGNFGSLAKTAFSALLGWPLDIVAAGIIDAVVALAELLRNALFAGPVLIVSVMFDYAVWFNVAKSILNVVAVKEAWGVMQGLANMFFILILLWIALATIFDFEEYTAKKLLPKLIVMALLINFSLVITGIVVDFTNGLGYYFYKQISQGGLIFVQIMNDLSVSRLFNFNNQSPGGATTQQIEQQITNSVDPFKAVGLDSIDPKLQSGADTVKKELASTFYSPGQKSFAAVSRLVALIITTILGIILIVVLIFGIGFLIARQVTIMFLGIFSPLVFLANILPQTKKHWDNWWEKLTQQAFFAPAYLFCLLATFKFLQLAKNNIYTENSAGEVSSLIKAQASAFDVGFLFFYLLAAAMMIASLIVAQKMGIYLGSTAVGLAKKTQGYFKTALKEQGAKMAAGTAGKFLESKAGAAMARMPLLKTLPQAAVQIQAAEAKRAKERAELYSKLSPQDLASDFSKYSKTEQDALAKTLSENQKPKIIGEMLKNDSFESLAPEIQRGLLSGIKEFIPEAELAARGVKKNEARYDTEMQRLITEKSRELGNIRMDSLDNNKVRDALKKVGTPRDWETLASTSKGARKVADMWAEDQRKAASQGITMSQLILRDYNNSELAQYANTSPFSAMVAGNVVRPQKRRRQGGSQQGGGQQTPPGGGGPGTPPPGTIPPTARPSATYTTPPPGGGGPGTPPAPPGGTPPPTPPPAPPPPIMPSPRTPPPPPGAVPPTSRPSATYTTPPSPPPTPPPIIPSPPTPQPPPTPIKPSTKVDRIKAALSARQDSINNTNRAIRTKENELIKKYGAMEAVPSEELLNLNDLYSTVKQQEEGRLKVERDLFDEQEIENKQAAARTEK